MALISTFVDKDASTMIIRLTGGINFYFRR